MSATHVIGIADCAVSNDPDAMLVTYALGSCIAVTLYDSVSRIAGMLHLMLPESSIDSARGQSNPYMFANTGIPLLFNRAFQQGAEKRRLVVRLVGGAQVMDSGGVFNIGKRNQLSTRKILWKAGYLIHGEETGGTVSRTVKLEVGTGKLWIREGAQAGHELGASSPAKGVL
ncbi:MAG: chemotaxis protein CheD [Bryobacteraceae bacterium]